jgi:hypothetical protein
MVTDSAPSARSATSPYAPSTSPRSPRLLALGAIAGPVLFTVAWLVLGWVSPGYTVSGTWISPYSPIAQPISGLGLGTTAPYMTVAFVLTGLLLLAGVLGIMRSLPAGGRGYARRASRALLAMPAVGFVIVGLFNLEQPVMHLFGANLILAIPVIGFLVTGAHLRGLPGWRRLGTGLLVASPVTLVLYAVYVASFNQDRVALNHGVAGLTQRILFIEILFWFVAMARHARQHSR